MPGTELTNEQLMAIAGPPSSAPVRSAAPAPRRTLETQPEYTGQLPTDPRAVFSSLVQQESGGRAGVLGPQTQYGRAEGRTQMLPATARETAQRLGVPWQPELMRGTSPEAAAYQDQLGLAYLEQGYQETGNMRDALRYYHGGPNRRLWGPKTRGYSEQILNRIAEGGAATQSGVPDASPASPTSLSDDDLIAIANRHVTGGISNDGLEALIDRAGSSRENPFVITADTPREQLSNLTKGTWINVDGQTRRLAGDAYINQNGAQGDQVAAGGNAFLHEVDAEDALRAFTTAAAEQVPGLDEAAQATVAGLQGRSYSDVRDDYQNMNAVDNQTNRGVRDVGGIAGAATGLLAPGIGASNRYIQGAEGAARLGRAGLVNAGYGAVYGAGNADGGLRERLMGGGSGAAFGFGAGAIGQRGADALGGLALAAQTRAPSPARLLSQAGVELTPGQMLGGFAKRAEDGLTSIPLLGDSIRSAQTRGLESLNDAALAGPLEQIGATVGGRGRQRMADVGTAFSEAYNTALNPVSAVPAHPTYAASLAAIEAAPDLPPNLRRNLRSLIANTVGRADDTIDGQAWKRIDSELSADINAADRAAANAPEQRLLRDQLRAVRDLWSERLDAVAPDALAAVRNTDDAFANMKIVQKATGDVASAGRGGEASPATLNRAVRSAAGEGRYTRGQGRLQELTDAAMAVMPSTVPDSGTPLRSLLSVGGLGGGAAAFGAAPAAVAGSVGLLGLGAAAYSRPVQGLLNNLYRSSGNGSTAATLEALLRGAQADPALIPLYEDAVQSLLGGAQNQPQTTPPAQQGLLSPMVAP